MTKRLLLFIVSGFFFTLNALGFCGFYVGKADSKLFNKASKVILARSGERTILTMSNDFQGDVKEFALVVPVPVVLKKEQVHIGDPVIIDRLDSFSAPRLVEYFDHDPCRSLPLPAPTARPMMQGGAKRKGDTALGVKVEEAFTVGEYDIVVLSASESSGLEMWLNQNGYKIPAGAAEILEPYIKTKTKFFVAKVNLAEFEKTGFQYLRPLQMAFESPKFMLPIRLGMINASQEQDLIVFALSPMGRVEVTNYRTVKIPSDMDIPEYVKDVFPDFYRSMFQRSYEKEGKNAVFVEYAWDMAWCDPCAADPLTPQELRKAGVFWVEEDQNRMPGASNVYITRLHVRYGRPKFPEDLVFQETPNRENFQGRYVMRHAFKGDLNCEEGKRYLESVRQRREIEANRLASLTGWDITEIRKKMGVTGKKPGDESWWDRVFGEDKD